MDGVVARISNKAVFWTINVFLLKKVVYYFVGAVLTYIFATEIRVNAFISI
ncbi:hypothetical protein Barb6_00244 [Bacteroidales bacterium Barb6]|nr:hypothetical protein Barb6_00244 [Bacteroidales bacterium Barb6]